MSLDGWCPKSVLSLGDAGRSAFGIIHRLISFCSCSVLSILHSVSPSPYNCAGKFIIPILKMKTLRLREVM